MDKKREIGVFVKGLNYGPEWLHSINNLSVAGLKKIWL